MTAGAPPLSVVVISFNGAAVLRRCLASVAGEAAGAGADLIVVRNQADGEARAALTHEWPAVRWIAADGATVPVMRRAGMAASRGAIVALLEDDCLVRPGWCAAILAAHRTADVAIGGAVEPGSYRRGMDWGVFFCEYARFMPPLPGRTTTDLASNNVSYKRAVIDALAPEEPFYDVFVHRRWARAGLPLRADGAIVVEQAHARSWHDVTGMPFHHGRGFAGSRWPEAGPGRRLAAAALALALPAVATARIMRLVLERGRLRHLPRAFLWIVLFTASWSLGESAGYLLGPGTSLSRWR